MFDIVATTGQLRTKAALDYEDPDADNPYYVKVTATDTSGADYITGQIAIYVNDVEEPGTVTLSSLQPLVAIPLTATLDDLDVVVSGSLTWSWARSPDGTSSWNPISGKTSDTYTPVAGDVGDYLRATAAYTDGAGPDKSAQASPPTRWEVAPEGTRLCSRRAPVQPAARPKPPQRAWISARRWRPPMPTTTPDVYPRRHRRGVL